MREDSLKGHSDEEILVASAAPCALDGEVLERLRALAVATDPSLLDQIFEAFLLDGQARISTMRRALQEGDAMCLHHAAHALKGAGASIGAHGVAGIAQKLQALGGSVEGADLLIEPLEVEFERVRAEIAVELEARAQTSA